MDQWLRSRRRRSPHAREWGAQFFDCYHHDHRHSGIGYHTPHDMHHGLAEVVREVRADTLADAYRDHPERFVHGPLEPPRIPTHAWINKPTEHQEHAPAQR